MAQVICSDAFLYTFQTKVWGAGYTRVNTGCMAHGLVQLLRQVELEGPSWPQQDLVLLFVQEYITSLADRQCLDYKARCHNS